MLVTHFISLIGSSAMHIVTIYFYTSLLKVTKKTTLTSKKVRIYSLFIIYVSDGTGSKLCNLLGNIFAYLKIFLFHVSTSS